MTKFPLLASDRRIWNEELADFVPKRVFDAHAHVHDIKYAPRNMRAKLQKWPRITFKDLQLSLRAIFPGRETYYLATGWPWRDMDVDGMNAFISREVKDSLSRTLMIAPPDFTVKKIEATLEEGGFSGFKPYMCLSKNVNTVQSAILQMLPGHYWKIANERELIILLHLGRYRSLADPINQRQIRTMAEKYPGVKLQLAHCARCFTPEIAEKGLSAMADLPNVHMDTSAVCDTEVFHILFDAWPLEKILFGTDNVGVGMARGKITTFGYGWYTISESNAKAFSAPHVPDRPTFLAYENLRAIRYAARRKKWGRREQEDFFWNNAARIFGLEK